jgi:hypothetical protein
MAQFGKIAGKRKRLLKPINFQIECILDFIDLKIAIK